MRKCELCKLPARLYCESDQASLCTGCDAKVHEANFLVARHSRTLLCRTCQCRTPWTASGARLGNTTTECVTCAVGEGDNNNEVLTDEEVEGSGEISGSDQNEGLPWSYTPIGLSLATPPPAASSSRTCSDECSSSSSVCSRRRVSVKRMRECDDVDHRPQPQNELAGSSSSGRTCSRRRPRTSFHK